MAEDNSGNAVLVNTITIAYKSDVVSKVVLILYDVEV